MTEARFPLVVQFLLAGALVSGTVDLQEERRRLVDLLNGQSPLVLTSVSLSLPGRANVKQMPAMTLSKGDVLVAIPRETIEQTRQRTMQTSMVGRSSTMHGRMAILLPPVLVEGTAHGPGGSAKLIADPAIFPRFFLVTDAEINLSDGSSQSVPLALVNRDSVAGMSLLPDQPKQVEMHPAPTSVTSSMLDRLIANS